MHQGYKLDGLKMWGGVELSLGYIFTLLRHGAERGGKLVRLTIVKPNLKVLDVFRLSMLLIVFLFLIRFCDFIISLICITLTSCQHQVCSLHPFSLISLISFILSSCFSQVCILCSLMSVVHLVVS